MGGGLRLDAGDAPLHFEGMRLRSSVAAFGWELAGVCTVGGVGLAVAAKGALVEAVGVVLTLIGSVLLVAMLRCRRFEIVVGPRLVEAGAGPLRRRIPVGFIERSETREAGSWRRLFAETEIVFWLTARERMLVVPTRDPAALIEAVTEAHTGSSS
jgi:hypothetical protein